MKHLVLLSDFLDRWITRIGKTAAWAGVFLIAVTIFDVVTRRFFVLGSTKLQEFEWHLHTILFAFCLGFAYLADAHVRIDLVRNALSKRTQWWIELLGVLLFMLPYCAVIIYYGIDFTHRSFIQNEASASATGLSHRWIIKSVIPIGFGLLFLSGVAVILRKIVELFGPPDLRERVSETEQEEAQPLEEADMAAVRPGTPDAARGDG